MTDRNKLLEKIEYYLSGEMPAAEKEAFEKELNLDATLREEWILHSQLQEFLADEKALKLRKLMDDRFRERKRAKIISFRRRMLLAAASILAILMLGYYAFWGSQSLPDLYKKQFSPYQMVLSSRSGMDADSLLTSAISSYQNNRYEESLRYWSLLLSRDSANSAARFYRGICELAINQTEMARIDFAGAAQGEASLFMEQAHWYTLLSYLKDNNKAEACRLLQEYRQQEFKAAEMQQIRKSVCR